MKHLHLYNESIDTDKSYDYEYHSTEEGEVDGDKFTTYYYVFITKDGDKYYVSVSYFDYNTTSFTVDFQDEQTFVKDREEGKDFLTYTYINTNKFDAFKIITTVFKVIKDFYEYNIDTLEEFTFNCEDDKRHNIYKHIIKKLFPSWELSEDNKDDDGQWVLVYKFGEALNESLRDKMTPKTEEEIELAYETAFKKDAFLLSEYHVGISKIFGRISELMDEPLDNLYYIDDEECQHFITAHDYFVKILDNSPTTTRQVKITRKDIFYGNWIVISKLKLAYWLSDGDVVAWIFGGDIFKKDNLKESLRDKMTPKELSPEIKEKLIDTLDSISFLPVSDLKKDNKFLRVYSLDTIGDVLKSDMNDLYYVIAPSKDYYTFNDTYKNFSMGSYDFHDDGGYDYFMYKEFKIVWCEHDRYHNKLLDMYIVDLPYFKKAIQNL